MTNNLHELIVALLINRYNAAPNNDFAELSTMPTKEIIRKYFRNFRATPTATAGLRLTDSGHKAMQQYFKSYIVELQPDYKISSRDLLFLDHTAKVPWHYYGGKITLYEKDLALKIKLAGGISSASKRFS